MSPVFCTIGANLSTVPFHWCQLSTVPFYWCPLSTVPFSYWCQLSTVPIRGANCPRAKYPCANSHIPPLKMCIRPYTDDFNKAGFLKLVFKEAVLWKPIATLSLKTIYV